MSKYTVTFPDGCQVAADGYDMRKAAENAVEIYEYNRSEFPIAGKGEDVKVVVADDSGVSKTFTVEGEAVPMYTAKEHSANAE